MIKYKNGDLIKLAYSGHFDVIVHGCNCFNMMGSGIAAQVAKFFPEAKRVDDATESGNYNKLGTISVAEIKSDDVYSFNIVNAYTQFKPGRDLDYIALILCIRKIKKAFKGMRIGLPQIGCGIAGGDWGKVKDIIEQELILEDVTVVIFKPLKDKQQ